MKQTIEILQLSVRSTNCLKQENVHHIEDLIVLREIDLKHIPNMGEKSLNEIKVKLNEIGLNLGTDSYHNIDNKSAYVKEKSEIDTWLDSVSDVQLKKCKVESLFLSAVENLSARSCNAIKAELKTYNNIIDFLKYLFSLQSLSDLPNIGKTSEIEIVNFLIKIRQEIKCLYKSEKTEIKTTLDLMEYMNMSQLSINKYRQKYQDSDIHFFRIIDISIKETLNDNELKILQYRNDYWYKEPLTLDQLGKQLGVTRERIRQVEVEAEKKLWTVVKGLSNYLYLIDLREQYELYDDLISDISTINKQDEVDFSDNFLYQILAIFLENEYQLVIKNQNEYRFLISNHLNYIFDFQEFIKHIEHLLEKSTTDYSLYFKGLLIPYFKQTDNHNNAIKIEEICEELLYLKLGLIPDDDNQILIKSKRKGSVSIYVEDVLRKINRPMHLDEIYNEIKENYPKFDQSKRYIGNVFVGNDKFIFFDRNSTYGLKKWERKLTENSILIDTVKPNKTIDNRGGIKVWKENGKIIVRGGTIKNIVIEYLNKFKEPKHLNDIFSEVEKWRDTNKHKLESNLRANNRDNFIFHKGGYIGMANE